MRNHVIDTLRVQSMYCYQMFRIYIERVRMCVYVCAFVQHGCGVTLLGNVCDFRMDIQIFSWRGVHHFDWIRLQQLVPISMHRQQQQQQRD